MDEESILKSLTVNGDGILQTLDGLSLCGKIFFYSCVHLLEKPLGLDPNKHKNTLNTFKGDHDFQKLRVIWGGF